MQFINRLTELIQHNSTDTLEYIDDLNEVREIQQGINENKELRKQYNEMINSFYLSNGILPKVSYKYLNDEQKTYMNLMTQKEYNPNNRYRQHILNYYSQHLEDRMHDINLEYIRDDFAKNYYAMLPGLDSGLEKIQPQPLNLKPSVMANYIPLFIKIGECLQFDVEGFPKNELLYLLYGMAVWYAYVQKFTTFKELVLYLQSFIQLNLLSKCFSSLKLTFEGKPWNLVTFIEFKRGNIRTSNYRYSIAKKYITNDRTYNNTKLIEDDKGLYILTEMTEDTINKTWDKLEELYASAQYNGLITLWFDSQLMTRSTCLIGCMLIMVLNGKLVKFSKEEMPDWKAILTGNFEGTYEFIGEFDKITTGTETPTLNDVLFTLNAYTQMQNNQ